jgi:NAD(P)H-hydrate repair Nnr-like enzyme with NAD(P)H-hydrate dehydratase domain
MDAWTAAAAAAVAHGRAAQLVPHQSGLVASELLGTLPATLDA